MSLFGVSPLEIVVLVVAGVVAGYVNTIAGAGSLLTLPALVFAGLDANAANATNRISVLAQNIAGVIGYRQKGIQIGRAIWWLCLPAAVGALFGSYVATLVSERVMRACIAIAMVVFLGLSFVKPKKEEKQDPKKEKDEGTPLTLNWRTIVAFTFFGFYSGFLQAGIGILVLLFLSLFERTRLVDANVAKIVVVLACSVVSIAVFEAREATPFALVDPVRGLALAAGSVVGGYLGAGHSLERGDKFIRIVMILAIVASSIKLAWDALHG